MRLLAFSDLHRNDRAARSIVERSPEVDVVLGAGDFATVRRGLEEVIAILAAIESPTVVVAGNSETDAELRAACRSWKAATVLHGEHTEIDGVDFFGLGAAIPVTPFGSWSFDIDEDEARAALQSCPDGAVLVVHSPPFGHCDLDSSGRHLGSRAILEAIETKKPRLVVCGHIHGSWGERSRIGNTDVVNLGPAGVVIDV